MALTFQSEGVMEYLWDNLDKTEDGNHISYSLDDIDALWWMGFVDTDKYTLEKWREVFEPYKQPDDTYLLTRPAFLALEKYRYTGEIKIPFDAMLINEGKYTDEGLQELFDLSIRPSCYYPPDGFQQYVDDFKKRHREADGLIKIDKTAKLEIKGFIDTSPSPLRNLELTLDRMIEDGVDEKLAEQLHVNETARATTEAAKQVSQFSSTPTSAAEIQSQRLQDLQKVKKKKPRATAKKSKKPSTELKKIRRSRKGMRG